MMVMSKLRIKLIFKIVSLFILCTISLSQSIYIHNSDITSYSFVSSYLKHKKGSLEEAILETVKIKSEDNTNDKSDDGEGLDAVQPKAVKKKFTDRKDKDIDNDGDVDSSDKYLHKRRKAISKASVPDLVIYVYVLICSR